MKKLILAITVVLAFFFSKAQPTISSVNPLKARIDSLVTITGTNFIANVDSNIVHFGPVRAVVTSATTNQLVVKVPLGAGYQPISVTTRSLIATANMPFGVKFDGQTTLSNLSFESKIDSTSSPCYVTLSYDFDGDGKPDVASTNLTANTLTIYRNTSTNGKIAFASRQFVNTIDRVNNFRIVDIDGDGKKDLVTANFSSSNISVYRNTSTVGSISFASRVSFLMPTSTHPAYLASDDIDRDGKQDVLVTNYPLNGFAIFRNISTVGNINFATRIDYTTQGTYPAGVEIADLNNDGKKEIVLSNSQQSSISVFQNLSTVGNILLATSVQYATTSGVHEVSIADLNEDGKLDIVAGDYASAGAIAFATTITVFQNNTTTGASFNSTSFNVGVAYTAGLGTLGVRLGDMDGDGKTDVIVGNNESNYVSVLRNNSTIGGNISLVAKFDIVTGSKAFWPELADLNMDGRLDIIASNYGSSTLSFLKNNIEYQPPIITSVSPLRANIDSLITITGQNFAPTVENNTVYFGPIKANLVSASPTQVVAKLPLGTGYQPLSLTRGGIVGGGLSASANMPSNVKFSNASPLSIGSFSSKIDSSLVNAYLPISGDIDGDGKPDVLIANFTSNSITIYRNTTTQNNISFATKQTLQTINQVNNLFVSDIDGDGKKDIIAPNFNSNSFSVFKNTSSVGDISFASRLVFNMPIGTNPAYLNVNDIDGDGKFDVLIGNYPINGFSIFRNTSANGIISFASRLNFATIGIAPTQIEIADLNNDGKKEIIVCNSQENSISVYRNLSSPGVFQFNSPINYPVAMASNFIQLADLNNDGKLDIVSADYSSNVPGIYTNTITVLQNNAIANANFEASSFNAGVQYIAGDGTSQIRLADLDGDEKTDVFVGNLQSNFISVFRNTSLTNGTISLANKFDIFTGNNAGYLELADLTDDGKLDLIVCNWGSNRVSFLKNNTVILSNPLLLQFTASSKNNTVQLNWELSNTSKIDNIIVEHSTNAAAWQPLVIETSPNAKSAFVHKTPNNGKNFYILHQTNKDGKKRWSDIRVIDFGKTTPAINVYPNPVKNGSFTIDLGFEPTKIIQFIITNIEGKIAKTGWLANRQNTIYANNLNTGTYFIKLEDKAPIKLIVE
jgi:hypothetical protein